MTLYHDKYRIESVRLQGWNYAYDGSYFLTICAHNRACFLGEILNSKMHLSLFGEIVREELLRSFEIRQELKCIRYVIMPNHLHLIVNIVQNAPFKRRASGLSVIQPKSISSFVAGFKASATTRINTIRNTKGEKVWQVRFYDHLIRDDSEFAFIANYITQNPATWHQDRFYEKRDPDA